MNLVEGGERCRSRPGETKALRTGCDWSFLLTDRERASDTHDDSGLKTTVALDLPVHSDAEDWSGCPSGHFMLKANDTMNLHVYRDTLPVQADFEQELSFS